MPNLSPEETFESMKQRVEEALRRQFPLEGRTRRLELVSVTFDEKAAELLDSHHVDNIKAQFDARTKGKTWGVPIKAEVRLVEQSTNKELERKTVTLGKLPKLTRRYSYIVDGQERQHDSLFRSKPRPYHRIANNGEIQARWNLAGKSGFDITYDPKRGLIRLKVGNSNIPILPVLKALGESDAAAQRAWGRVIYETNVKASSPSRDIAKLYKALKLRAPGMKKDPDYDGQVAAIRKYFHENTEVWPDAMKSAFGKEYTHVNGENLLLSSKRLVDIQKGRTKDDPAPHELPDDRQSLSEKYLVTTEDFIVEALDKKTRELRRKVLDRIDRPEVEIDNISLGNAYSRVITGVFDYSQRPDQTNPLQFVSGYMRTTIRGKAFGGVGSDKTNVDKDKLINPTHLGFLDPIQTPESDDTGIALHLPLGIQTERAAEHHGRKSKTSTGQVLKTKVYDKRKNDWVMVTPAEIEYENVAYPDQVKWVSGKPYPLESEVVCYDKSRHTTKRPWSQVRYVLPSSKALFSFSANLIPFLQNDNGNRAMMAAKQQEQAVSLANREAPLVQVKTDGAATFEKVVGSFSAHRSPVAGKVTKIEPDTIHIKTGRKTVKVPIYHNYPLNGGKGVMTAYPTVKVGQEVKKGQLIADTNYTKDGNLALGSNLRVAYVPWKGLNFEDGIVVSESAAKKMSSEHMHQQTVTVYPGMRGGAAGDKVKWVDYALPEKATPERLEKLDDTGVIKEGSTVEPGDVLVAVLSPTQETKEDEILTRIHKSMVYAYKDRALMWDHEYPGEVVKVIRSPGLQKRTITVHVKTAEPLVVGDKLSGRHGNKGIVSRIVPDDKMPKDKNDQPVHVLLNPAGVPSRMNVGQVLETAASKIAKKTGKPYVIENFVPGTDYAAKVKKDLAKHGLSDTEELFDPDTGRSIGPIMVGDQYLLKLHHMVEKKMTARSYGTGYTGTGDAPSGAGVPGGGQKLDTLAAYAMLAHGAKHNLREAYTFKSDGEQEEVWDAVETGRPLPPPRPTRGMQNFRAYLEAMGIHSEKVGDEYTLSPLTDAHVLGDKKKGITGVSNGEVPMPDKALYAKGARTLEETQGLFDPRITGGRDGEYWSHIDLADRMPNPVFEPAIQTLLGMTQKEYEKLTGPKLVDGKDGFEVIREKLAAIDVDKELAAEKERLPHVRAGKLNLAYKRVRYLEALKKQGISPLEAYTNKALPVIPPRMRKVSIGLDGKQILDDLNNLYLAVGQANMALKRLDRSTSPESRQKTKSHLYASIKGLRMTGMDLGRGGAKRHHTGLMEKLTGKVQGQGAPKYSYFQRGVLGRRQDLSGRSTIVPEPDMSLDEVGIPTPVALEMYRPFVIRELFREGTAPLKGGKLVDQKHPRALRALRQVIKERPVMLKRDPVLHKFGIMAFKPKLVDGKAIKIHPLIVGGFNADFDGDSMALYVPVSDEAADEAKGMLPSKHLFSATNYGLMTVPDQDSLLGLYQATKWGKEVAVPSRTTAKKAVEMMEAGQLKPSDVITLNGKKTTPGRLALAQALPPDMREDPKLLHDAEYRLDKKRLKSLLGRVARKSPQHFPVTVDAWKNRGNRLSFLHGSSFSLNDFHDGVEFRDYFLGKYKKKEQEIRRSKLSRKQKDKEIVNLYESARKELQQHGQARYNRQGSNRMWEWGASGARGGWGQFSQLVFGPMLVDDPEKKKVPVPITKSYGEGLPLAQYWASMHGARKGTIDRAAGTSEPGALTKDIINTTINYQITGEDCGTTSGSSMSPADNDAIGRYLAKKVTLKDGTVITAGTLVNSALSTRMQNSGVTQIVVRSPLHCKMQKGLCAKCYGMNENGRHHHVGTNVGVLSGQALGEPVTQLTMRTFHTGGASSDATVVDAFQRVQELFMVPNKLPNEAVLAEVSGTVQSVKKDPRGGHSVYIAGKEHRIVTGAPLPTVRAGIHIQKGQPLSPGPIDPKRLLSTTRNMGKVRAYMTDEIDKAYGGLVRKRNIETVVKAMTNLTSINSAPSESGWLRGQTVPLSEVDEYNAKARAEGRETVKHTPQLRPMTQIPLGQEDWMARLNYQRMKETYQEGASQGWASNIHGHPIPGLAHGAEFGTRPVKPLPPPTSFPLTAMGGKKR